MEEIHIYCIYWQIIEESVVVIFRCFTALICNFSSGYWGCNRDVLNRSVHFRTVLVYFFPLNNVNILLS